MDSISYFEIGGEIIEVVNTSIPSPLHSPFADRRERLRGAPTKSSEKMSGGRQGEQPSPMAFTPYSGTGMPIPWMATQVLLRIAQQHQKKLPRTYVGSDQAY